MKTITNISATTVADDSNPTTAPMGRATFIRAGKTIMPKFQRRMRLTANGIYFESSAGGQVLITNESLWAAAEANEPLLAIPKTT